MVIFLSGSREQKTPEGAPYCSFDPMAVFIVYFDMIACVVVRLAKYVVYSI